MAGLLHHTVCFTTLDNTCVLFFPHFFETSSSPPPLCCCVKKPFSHVFLSQPAQARGVAGLHAHVARLAAAAPRSGAAEPRNQKSFSVLNAPAQVLWRTAESFGDFKEHAFALQDGSTFVMRGRRVAGLFDGGSQKCDAMIRPTHLNARCTRRRIEIANQWSRDLALELGLRLMDAAQVIGTNPLISPVTILLSSLISVYTSHITRRTSHVTHHTSHVTRHTSQVLSVRSQEFCSAGLQDCLHPFSSVCADPNDRRL